MSPAIQAHPAPKCPAKQYKVTCTLANYLLRMLGVAIEPIRGTELAQDRVELAAAVRKGNEARFGDQLKAIAAYTRALKIDPKCRPAILGRSRSQQSIGKYEEALADCDLLLKISPGFSSARKQRIYTFEAQRNYAIAIAEYKALLADEPEWAYGHRELAWLLTVCPDLNFRDGVLAVEHARRAVELRMWPLWRNDATLAAAYAESGDFEEAASCATLALAHAGGAVAPVREDLQRLLKLYQDRKKYEP